jgi:hypothetical protein
MNSLTHSLNQEKYVSALIITTRKCHNATSAYTFAKKSCHAVFLSSRSCWIFNLMQLKRKAASSRELGPGGSMRRYALSALIDHCTLHVKPSRTKIGKPRSRNEAVVGTNFFQFQTIVSEGPALLRAATAIARAGSRSPPAEIQSDARHMYHRHECGRPVATLCAVIKAKNA